jgi:cholesterol oxidase
MKKVQEVETGKISRRRFVSIASLSAAAIAVNSCAKVKYNPYKCDTTTTPDKRKAIIIGSGFAGCIAAHRLTEAGYEVLLLERGKFWDTGDGTQTIFAPPAGVAMANMVNRRADKRSTFLGTICANPFLPPVYNVERYIGVMERIDAVNMTVIAPALLGGGTAVYGGIFAQPNEEMYNQVFPAAVPYSEMNSRWFPLVKQNFQATKMPEDIAQHASFKHYERFKADNLNAGFEVEKVDITYDWDKIRDEINGTRIASSIIGESMFGCSSGARHSAEFNYLKWAQESGRLEVKTQSMVKDVAKNCDGNYLVYVNEIDESGRVIKKVTYETEYLFMAAGSVNTSKLMTRAKAKSTLPDLNDEVGKGWGHNGSTFILRQSLSHPVGKDQAFPPNYGSPDYANPIAPIYIEHLAFPLGFECDCLSYFAIGLVKDYGIFSYNSRTDDVMLNYPHSSQSYQKTVNQAFFESVKKINDHNGGTNSTVIGAVPKSDSSAHPCGGMVIGKATDFFGRVKNNNKLYVIDGALLPGCCALANPAMTISALAERSMEHILANDF